MAELTTTDKLYPSLLDRLRDDTPSEKQESRDQRVISMKRLREFVLRDIGWLLNTVHLQSHEDFSAYPEVARSVLNFGGPCLTGSSIELDKINVIELKVKEAILAFEPRINSRSLNVRVTLDSQSMSRSAMIFEISGELWGQPLPISLYLKTEVDLETGDVTVSET